MFTTPRRAAPGHAVPRGVAAEVAAGLPVAAISALKHQG